MLVDLASTSVEFRTAPGSGPGVAVSLTFLEKEEQKSGHAGRSKMAHVPYIISKLPDS